MKTIRVRRVLLGFLCLAFSLVSSCETVVYHPVRYAPTKKSSGGVTSGGSVRGPVSESVNFQ